MKYTINGLCDFLRGAVSSFHAVREMADILDAAGFVRLQEGQRWQIAPGGRYYTTRNQSSLIAFTVPQCGFAPVCAVASHSDSPVFRLKQNAELEIQGKYLLLNVERYGGMIMSTWMDRPLSVAGRVLVRGARGLETKLVDIDRDALLIPSLAIHMNREVNESNRLNAQTDMLPLLGDAGVKGSLIRQIAENAGISPEQIAGSDLYLYNRMPPRVWGESGEYISAARLDDLECAYTALCAFTEAKAGAHINCFCCFDNEEVGSGTRQGADSTLLSDVLRRAAAALGAGEEEFQAALASSFMVSADNAHAMHPHHPEKYDQTNRVFMNEGVVIKFSANQKYTTDGVSCALFADVCRRAGVPVQYFANRSDMVGGSTLGNISGAHVSIPTVDIGLAQLAMHSSYETAGIRDAQYMASALTACYETELSVRSDGVYEIG